jgi:hypothetical protein
MVKRLKDGLVVLLAAWAGLAQIAPELFQVRADSGAVGRTIAWLWSPAVAWIILPVIVFWFLYRLSAVEQRLLGQATSDQTLRADVGELRKDMQRLTVALAEAPSSAPATQSRPLAENELDEAGTRWSWDGNEAQGPTCPRHGDRLKLVKHLGGNTADVYANFEDEYLGAFAWFGCPSDLAEEFRVKDHIQVKALRRRVNERFRAKYKLPSLEAKTEPVKFSRETMEAFGSIFPGLLPAGETYKTVLPNGTVKWWTVKEIDGLPAPQLEKLDKDLLAWWKKKKRSN